MLVLPSGVEERPNIFSLCVEHERAWTTPAAELLDRRLAHFSPIACSLSFLVFFLKFMLDCSAMSCCATESHTDVRAKGSHPQEKSEDLLLFLEVRQTRTMPTMQNNATRV